MKKIAILVFTALTAMGAVRAQYDETNNIFYHAHRVPQSLMYNPALFPTNTSFFLMMPGADFRLGFPLAMNEVIKYDPARQLSVININSMMDSLSTNNKLRMGVDAQLFGFGVKMGNTFFNVNTRLVSDFSFGLPTSTIRSIIKGNVDDNMNPVSEMTLANGDLFYGQAYLETALGVGHRFDAIGLTVGGRVKLLSGLFNIQTDQTRIEFNTSSDFDSVSARAYYQIQEAAVVDIDTSEGISSVTKHLLENVGKTVGSMFDLNKGNTGIAFDLGVRFDLGDFTFSAAVRDLSAGIHWQKNVNTLVPKNGQGVIEFYGVDLNTMLNNGELTTESLRDSLNAFLEGLKPKFNTEDTMDYWFSIPTKLDLGVSYGFAEMFRAGILFHGQFDRGLLSKKNATELDLSGNVVNTFRFNTTLSLAMNLYNWLEVIVASSAVYDGKRMDLLNPGAGLVLTPLTVLQVYVMADYISSLNITESKSLNLKAGVNLLLGKGGRSYVKAIEED